MAKTLAETIQELKTQNEGQLVEQTATRKAIDTLNDKFDSLLDRTPTDAEREEERREAKREASRRVGSSAGGSGSSSSGLSNLAFFGLGGLASSLGGLAATAAGIAGAVAGVTAAFAGLGPTMRDFRLFLRTLRTIVEAPAKMLNNLGRLFGGRSFSAFIVDQVTRLRNFLSRQFTFDPRSGSYRNLQTGRYASPGAYQRILARLDNLFGGIRSVFSAIRIPEAVTKSFDRFAGMFRDGGRFSGILPALRNNRFVSGFTRLLRPIAAVLSLFDGFRNAQAELEDREGFFNRLIGGGIGGFVSGTIGSFFGEFANLIRDAIFWPIKQILPDEWLIENADGSVSINRETNWFTNFLGGLADIDFNRMLRNIVQVPFDQVGRAFNFIGKLFTGEGNVRQRLQDYWDRRGLFGTATDVLGWALNLAFSPLNGVLREIETAFFGADPERERETFTQRVSRYMNSLVDLVWSILPSWEDLRAAIIDILPDNRVGDFVRTRVMGVYSPEEAAARATEIDTEIARLEELLANAGPLGASNIEGQIAALQVERRGLGVAPIAPSGVSTNRTPEGITLPPPTSTAALEEATAAFLDAASGAARNSGGSGGGSVPQMVPVPFPVDRIDQGRPW